MISKYIFKCSKKIGVGFVVLCLCSPVMGVSTAYHIDDYPEFSSLPASLKRAIYQHKYDFTKIKYYKPYVDPYIGGVVIFGALSWVTFMSLIWVAFKDGRLKREGIKILVGVLLLFWVVAVSVLHQYLNPGGLFVTDKGLLFVEFPLLSLPFFSQKHLVRWIPYNRIKEVVFTNLVHTEGFLEIQVAKDVVAGYLHDLGPQEKGNDIKLNGEYMGGSLGLSEFLASFKQSYLDACGKLFFYQKEQAKSKYEESLLVQQAMGNASALHHKKIDIPVLLSKKVKHLRQKLKASGRPPLFYKIDDYVPYRPFVFETKALIYFIVLGIASGFLAKSQHGLKWVGRVLLVLISLVLIERFFSWISSTRRDTRHPGGWLFTDTGLLVVMPEKKLNYQFFPYDHILDLVPSAEYIPKVRIVSFPSFDIQPDDMGSVQVFDRFVAKLKEKVKAAKLLKGGD